MLVSAQNLRCISALSSSSYSTTHQFRAAPFCVSCRAPSVSVSQITNDADGNDVSTIIAAAVDDSGFDGGAGGGASGIHVPRQSYIAVSKSELLDAIISNMFPSHESEQAHQFLYLSQYLDSILHAEHKSILEEMRADYDLTLSTKGKRRGLNDSPHKGAHTYMNSSLKSGRIDEEPEEEIDSDISMSSNFAFNLKELLDSSLKRNSKGSRSALLLDVIAASALVIYVTRVLLGYKQTRDRYHLLVNRTLYEKTAASGFGCIYFLLDASEQQQYKEAILVYAILLKMGGGQVTGMRAVGDECERFIYNVFREKVEMPVEKSIDTLVRLGLVTRETVDGQIRVQAVPCSRAHAILQKRWSSLIGCGD